MMWQDAVAQSPKGMAVRCDAGSAQRYLRGRDGAVLRAHCDGIHEWCLDNTRHEGFDDWEPVTE